MLRRLSPAALAAALLAVTACAAHAPTPYPWPAPTLDGPPRVVGYLFGSGGRGRDSLIAAVDGRRVTHILYAFANVSPQGTMVLGSRCRDVGACDSASATLPDTLGGHFAALLALKRRYPSLRTLVSVGGWTWSGRFSDVALTDSSRRAFAASGIDLFIRRWPGVFDGIDVDWEYPGGGGLASNVSRPEDPQNFVLLLAELRRQLDEEEARTGRKLLLTIATSAHAPRGGGVRFDAVTPLVDWFNVMTYDFHTGGKVAHFNAPLYSPPGDPTPSYNVDSSVAMYIAAGVPRDRIVVGVPFYGRMYGGVAARNDGLLQPATAPVPSDVASGGGDYRSLVAKKLAARGFLRHWEPTARVPWLYDPGTGTWISYDDPQSLAAKADYVRANALGGVMIWELGGDDGTLLPALHDRLVRR